MRKNKGVTLISLVITVIVLTIIASVGTYSGISALKNAKENKLISELQMVQHAVLENYTKYLTTKGQAPEDKYIVGIKLTKAQVQAKVASGVELKAPSTITGNSQEYYLLEEKDLAKIGITQSNYPYIVNYATGEVINAEITETESGEPLYVYSVDLR